MKTPLFSRYGTSLVLLLISMLPGMAQTIDWRVSVKFILDANGNRPADTLSNKLATDAEVQAQIDYGNWVLARFGRGYRLKLKEIVNVSGQSSWFNADAAGDGNDPDSEGDPKELKNAVMDSYDNGSNAFKYDPASINIYIVNGFTAGSCSCSTASPAAGDLIVLSQNINPDWVVLHECGHFLGLPHTHIGNQFQNSNGSNCTNKCSCAVLLPGDDGIADTLPDHDCWDTADQIAAGNFNGKLFASLAAFEKTQVNNTLSNIMSYHGSEAAPRDALTGKITGPASRSVLTADQMDIVTDFSNSSRSATADGQTFFVDRGNNAQTPLGNSKAVNIPAVGLYGGPFPTIKGALAQAGGADIVLIRPGTYTDSTRLDKAVTLRATRGNATLRAP